VSSRAGTLWWESSGSATHSLQIPLPAKTQILCTLNCQQSCCCLAICNRFVMAARQLQQCAPARTYACMQPCALLQTLLRSIGVQCCLPLLSSLHGQLTSSAVAAAAAGDCLCQPLYPLLLLRSLHTQLTFIVSCTAAAAAAGECHAGCRGARV
jgi:hypothetical protein